MRGETRLLSICSILFKCHRKFFDLAFPAPQKFLWPCLLLGLNAMGRTGSAMQKHLDKNSAGQLLSFGIICRFQMVFLVCLFLKGVQSMKMKKMKYSIAAFSCFQVETFKRMWSFPRSALYIRSNFWVGKNTGKLHWFKMGSMDLLQLNYKWTFLLHPLCPYPVSTCWWKGHEVEKPG